MLCIIYFHDKVETGMTRGSRKLFIHEKGTKRGEREYNGLMLIPRYWRPTGSGPVYPDAGDCSAATPHHHRVDVVVPHTARREREGNSFGRI